MIASRQKSRPGNHAYAKIANTHAPARPSGAEYRINVGLTRARFKAGSKQTSIIAYILKYAVTPAQI